jgi:DNA-binding transcriptional ArsR family regulator
MARATTNYSEIFKALGDPIRWSIIQRMASVEELACSTLEENLPISKPTISYHVKILVQAGLVDVRKEARNLYYQLRRDVLRRLVDEMWALAPEPRPVRGHTIDYNPVPRRRRRREDAAVERPHDREVAVLTG